MSLPLKERAAENDPYFCLVPETRSGSANPAGRTLLPGTLPGPGQQYRFHFDMTKCIGCRCCEVACNEQNNNPAEIRWRRVGEIEGGSYPLTRRFYLSMGCNHCLEPSCLTGCPVDAYRKEEVTGLVLHSADTCIGCQYCTWNCSYGVPQYNPERGVVGKCDMCHGRLAEGREPACANACPEGAIRIELVDIGQWRREFTDADAPGLPPADHTISTTRITLPKTMPAEVQKADYHRVRPEEPHIPLVAMTVLTQFSVGAFAAVWLLECLGQSARLGMAALAALWVGMLSLAASTLHLGRPIYAYRALRMWRRSWLSREVLLFSLFSMSASAYAGALWAGLPGTAATGALTALLGAAGVTASAYIYLVPARPAWNTKHTPAEFFFTGMLLGPLSLAALGLGGKVLLAAAMAGAAGQLLNQALKFLRLIRSEEFELRASARLLSSDLEKAMLARFGLLVAGGLLLPVLGYSALALALALAGEMLGRYLFFVSVVPKNMAASFFGAREAA